MSQKKEQIYYLIQKKFPIHYNSDKKTWTSTMTLTKKGYDKQYQEVDAYMKQLLQKSSKEVKGLYRKEKRQEAQETERLKEKFKIQSQESERTREKSFFFEKPDANLSETDINHYANMAYWTLDEAASLSFGKLPTKVTPINIQSYKNSSSFAKKYMDTYELVKRSLEIKELKHQLTSPRDTIPKIQPHDYLNWAEKKGIEFPEELQKMVLARGDQSTDWQALCEEKCREIEEFKKNLIDSQDKCKEQVTKARAATNSSRILKMALAIIAQDKYKYGKESSSIGTMVSYFEQHGLTVDDETLRNHINEGLELIKNKESD